MGHWAAPLVQFEINWGVQGHLKGGNEVGKLSQTWNLSCIFLPVYYTFLTESLPEFGVKGEGIHKYRGSNSTALIVAILF